MVNGTEDVGSGTKDVVSGIEKHTRRIRRAEYLQEEKEWILKATCMVSGKWVKVI